MTGSNYGQRHWVFRKGLPCLVDCEVVFEKQFGFSYKIVIQIKLYLSSSIFPLLIWKTWKKKPQWVCSISIYMKQCKLWEGKKKGKRRNSHSRQMYQHRHLKALALLMTRPSPLSAITPMNWKSFNMPLSYSFCIKWMDKELRDHSDCSVGRLIVSSVCKSGSMHPFKSPRSFPFWCVSSIHVRCTVDSIPRVLLVSVLVLCFC